MTGDGRGGGGGGADSGMAEVFHVGLTRSQVNPTALCLYWCVCVCRCVGCVYFPGVTQVSPVFLMFICVSQADLPPTTQLWSCPAAAASGRWRQRRGGGPDRPGRCPADTKQNVIVVTM